MPAPVKKEWRDGDQRWCKDCETWKHENGFYRKSGYRCKSCRNAQITKQRSTSGKGREHKLWIRYRLTPEDVQAMKDEQEGRCAICKRELKPRATAVDHDHNTGVVRALLCYGCNAAIGVFNDDPDALRRAAEYIEQHRK